MRSAFVMGFILFSFSAFADKHVENGGDPVGLEFQERTEFALREVKADIAAYPSALEGVDLESILSKALVLVSDDPLYVEIDGVKQVSAALNSHDPDKIVINRAAWNQITDDLLKESLGLHEVLGLAGIESTGDYSVSRLFLNRERGNPHAGSATDLDSFARSFEVSRAPTADELNGIWQMTGEGVDLANPEEMGEAGPRVRRLIFENFVDGTVRGDFRYENHLFDNHGNELSVTDWGPMDALLQSTGVTFEACLQSDTYRGRYDYQCRISVDDLLICSAILNGPENGIPPILRNFLGKTVKYEVYTKVPDPAPAPAVRL